MSTQTKIETKTQTTTNENKDHIQELIEKHPFITKEEKAEIIEAYRPLIIASIKRYCPIQKEYQDLYNDGVVYLLESLGNYSSKRGTTFGAYLKAGLRIYYLDTLRYLMKYTDSPEYEEYMESTAALEEEYFQDKDYHQLYNAIGSLKTREREVIFLNFYKRETFQEIAEELEISLRTVNRIKQEALGKMKKYLEEN